MPSNDVLNRTPQHVAFKRARSTYARILRNYFYFHEKERFARNVVQIYLTDVGIEGELQVRILDAACTSCPKPSVNRRVQ